ncbi:dnaJ homolog subfamily B member 1-like [Coffea eugenioides]|uniref:dnaJ homolog subfamily B member 1-like n=1 Tax=Coffea eugenioides TaxID=49369 RepID=UPI000F609BEC|nr:dnaJ homolog subfamily B member 1-like [Coffea eugenioides]
MWKLCSKGFDKGNYQRKPSPSVWCPLRFTLDELYNGVEKRIKFTGEHMKLLPDPCAISPNAELETLVVNIPPGAKNGLRVVYPSRVILDDRKFPGDVIVDVIEEPHAEFHRQGKDLWAIRKIPLTEYVTKEALTIETLDKRLLTIPKTEPGCVMEIPNEGMPCWHGFGKTGSLFVSFEVIYPKNLSLTREEKDELKKLLAKEENDV